MATSENLVWNTGLWGENCAADRISGKAGELGDGKE